MGIVTSNDKRSDRTLSNIQQNKHSLFHYPLNETKDGYIRKESIIQTNQPIKDLRIKLHKEIPGPESFKLFYSRMPPGLKVNL